MRVVKNHQRNTTEIIKQMAYGLHGMRMGKRNKQKNMPFYLMKATLINGKVINMEKVMNGIGVVS